MASRVRRRVDSTSSGSLPAIPRRFCQAIRKVLARVRYRASNCRTWDSQTAAEAHPTQTMSCELKASG